MGQNRTAVAAACPAVVSPPFRSLYWCRCRVARLLSVATEGIMVARLPALDCFAILLCLFGGTMTAIAKERVSIVKYSGTPLAFKRIRDDSGSSRGDAVYRFTPRLDESYRCLPPSTILWPSESFAIPQHQVRDFHNKTACVSSSMAIGILTHMPYGASVS